MYGFVENDSVNQWDFLGLTALKYRREILDVWLLEVYQTLEQPYEPPNSPPDMLGVGDADSNISFSCSCINEVEGERADLSCKLVMRPVVRYPNNYSETHDHELRHVMVYENTYLPSFSALFSLYTSASKCCNCEERAAQINKYGSQLLDKLKKWDYYMEYFSKSDGSRAEPAIDYGASQTPNYNGIK